MTITTLATAALPERDVTIVGAGPVGIALALACAERGLGVLLIEAGPEHGDAPADQAGHRVDPARHAAPAVAMRRGIGGTSRWWGGRCVPFDDVDFTARPHLPAAAWPITHDEVRRYYPAAGRFFGIEDALAAGAAATPGAGSALRFDELEYWAPSIDMGERHRERLAASPDILVVTGAVVTAIALDVAGGRVAAIDLSGEGARQRHVPMRLVLACGGLETTRLLLIARASAPAALGGPEGPLGRYYMGHLSGKIADILLADPAAHPDHDFRRAGGAFVRRRLTFSRPAQEQAAIPNISFWADNPRFLDASHGNGLLSLVWLAMRVPPVGRRLVSEGVRLSHVGAPPHRFARHAANVLRSPLASLRDLGRILAARYIGKPRKPGFLLHSPNGRYPLHYHAEQRPDRASRVTLSPRHDRFGMPLLDIDLRFHAEDAAGIVRAHALLERTLGEAGIGRLDYRDPPASRAASVMAQATDGFHQIGGARMGSDPAESVVDADARVHGIANLFVASSAVFPSSGQANPTFLAVALALRLADHLAGEGNTQR